MRISLIKKNEIKSFVLPPQIHGNYWIVDKTDDGKERNFVNIVATDDDKWEMLSNYEVSVYDGATYVNSVILSMNKFYTLKVDKEEDTLLYVSEVYDKNTFQLMIKKESDVVIGSDASSQICCKTAFMAPMHARLTYKSNTWVINAVSLNDAIYVNNERTNSRKLNNGDVIFIAGLKIIIVRNTIIVNNIENIRVDANTFAEARFPKQVAKEFKENDEDIVLYKDNDYFFKAPRFRSSNEKVVLQIDAAPQQEKENKTPLIYTLGPMITMGMTSLMSAFTAINNVVIGGRSFAQALPSIIIATAMLATMIIWPLLTKRYQNKQRKAYQKYRVEKYTQYIESKRAFVREVMKNQMQSLLESFPSLDELKKTILYKKTNLWEREIDEDDFLKVRLGTGTIPVNMDIKYPEEHFTLEENDLKGILDNLVNDSKDLENVPITISFTQKYISAIIGEYPVISQITYGLILQLITYHSYDDLKLVFFTSEENEKKWEFAKVLPHAWSDDKQIRFFATGADDMKQVSSYLESEFQARSFKDSDPNSTRSYDYRYNKPYYFIIIDDFKTARDIEIIKDVLDSKSNVGFSIFILNDKLTNLPNECMDFICIGHNNRSVIFEGELVTNKQKKFVADLDPTLNLYDYALRLANIPIDTSKDEQAFPKAISFLEMYNVGKVEQLNSFNRWEVNVPLNSLQAPIGVDKQGNLFKLDLHEKFHGPHGLIAGMTGSGKSELIITYILSLAVNYHPNEVSFIIIDYKGGGVAGAFENKETGIKLPHIAGTITNLDTVEMNRSLVSIESELRRRQKAFNKARELSNESTIDIYKYQKLYRSGVVEEPISHLFIICDEFAELKLQQPEFMDQLISTARIGRSLGVHLILATQKPSGIVDDQIWSNSRFRICLKVGEKQDSMDMIKCPDAALLKNVGRFYLQVGYNEFFAEGLSAWCGAQYIPTDKLRRKKDASINFIDNIGYVTKSVDDDKKTSGINLGEQLSNIIKYLIDVANEQNIKVRQLWLDRIPNIIYVDDLSKKYLYKSQEYIINPIIGEYDDPSNQRQELLTMNLSYGGNAIIYGASGSGKTTLISSLIYSTILKHSAEEVNFYIMDFGSEMFRIFLDAPQVGDVLLVNDVEKVVNLFKMLNSIIAERKKKFVDYNGDFNFYNKKSRSKLPLIVVILNNYEAFQENYEKYEDILLQLTREGPKYGITFVVSVNSVNGMRYRLKQNFKQEFVLQMNDDTDYVTILGNTNKVYPSHNLGRGLIKLDKVYEFQAAYPYVPEQVSEYLTIICSKLKKTSFIFAERVAILPEVVTKEEINYKLKGLEAVPIGIDKNTLNVMSWDFKNNFTTTISALEFDNMNYFIKPFISQFGQIDNATVLVLDAIKQLDGINSHKNIFYYDKDFNNVINSLNENVKKQHEVYTKNNYNKDILKNVKPAVCIIIGINSLLMKLTGDAKTNYNTLIENANIVQTIKFIFIDTIDVFKKIEYDNWYKGVAKNSEGIWLGNGIANQYTLKISRITKELQDDIPNGFGYVVKRGMPTLTKFLTEGSYEGDNYE